MALFLLIGFFCQGVCRSAGSEPAQNEGQIEAVVIHVDEWAVYVPNLIFYFDTQMDKRKIETLKKVARQLRNKKALISYSSTEDLSKDKHAVLSDIVPAGKKRNLEKPVLEALKPPGDSQGEVVPKLSEEKVHSTEMFSSQTQISDKQVSALVEALRLSAPNPEIPMTVSTAIGRLSGKTSFGGPSDVLEQKWSRRNSTPTPKKRVPSLPA